MTALTSLLRFIGPPHKSFIFTYLKFTLLCQREGNPAPPSDCPTNTSDLAGPKPVPSPVSRVGDPPASTSLSAGITGSSYCAQPPKEVMVAPGELQYFLTSVPPFSLRGRDGGIKIQA
ncbi:hypothetical protein AAY473_026429 [Plecturocebus cupreus]